MLGTVSAPAAAPISADGGLFALAEQRLGWLQAREQVLAQNVANTDTPDYRPRDLAPFASWLGRAGVTPTRTSPLHLAGLSAAPAGEVSAQMTERAPDGNAVGLEDQMTKIADDESAQALVGNIWKSYMGLFMTALGHGS